MESNKKQIVRQYFQEFKVDEYDEISKNQILKWLNKLPDNVTIEIDVEEEDSGGCCGYKNIVHFQPFIRREETDKEYTDRLKKEEKARQEEQKRMEFQYQLDMAEYNRIRNKYNLK